MMPVRSRFAAARSARDPGSPLRSIFGTFLGLESWTRVSSPQDVRASRARTRAGPSPQDVRASRARTRAGLARVAQDPRESRESRASRAKVARVAAMGGSGGPKWGCNNATMGPCSGQLDSSGRAEGQAAMRDRKISIQTIKAAPRSFRLRGRFAPSRALISDVPALRDFCSPPSEVLGTSRASPRGQNSRRKLKFHQNRDT